MMRFRTDVPRASARLVRALACGASAVLLAAASVPSTGDGAVTSLSVEPTDGRAQVVIGVDGDVSVRDFVLHDPDRIVVDVTGATLGLRKGGYDRTQRGGVLDVRYAQNQPNVVRVVLTLAGSRRYQVTRARGEIRVSVEGGGEFAAWHVGTASTVARASRSGSAPTWLASSGSVDEMPRVVRVRADTPVTPAMQAGFPVDTPPPSPL